jgi:hypothetical protein
MKRKDHINLEILQPMTQERFLYYKKEIQRLKEIDNQITLKIQHQLNVMDQKQKCHG